MLVRTLIALMLAFALAAPSGAQPGEIEIGLDAFGVGGVAREGEWAGVRVRLTDRSDRPRAVAVRLICPDPDGDEIAVRRDVTLNPGVAQSVWLYAVLGWGYEATSALTVSVREIGEDGSLGRQLGAAPVQPGDTRPAEETMIGIVGPAYGGGLARYETLAPGRRAPATSHEITSVVGDIAPQDLPDRWMGFAQFEALVLIGRQPSELDPRQADAIVEWVRRGGRLFISLPVESQSWRSERDNPLFQIMPVAEHRRLDGARLEPYRLVLRPNAPGPLLPETATLHTFRVDPDEGPHRAGAILRGSDGGVVAVRRLVGAGDVTLIGFDLSVSALAAGINPQRFWHRLLGNRFDVRSDEELQTLRNSDRDVNLTSRDPQWIDRDIPYEIAKTGSAGAGVLLGLAIFALYLLLAGPLGFAALRKMGRERHAWLAFACVSAAFTLVAWGGVSAIRPRSVSVQHLTFLDVVYGQTEQRARSWLSVLIPSYGEQTIAIGDSSPDALNTLWPWRDPGAPSSSRFPDSREYELAVRDMAEITPPTRATVKQLRADWLGSSRWRTPYTRDESGVRLAGSGASAILMGTIEHRLPGALEDVVIILCLRQTPLTHGQSEGGPLEARYLAWRLTGEQSPWKPDTPLDLSTLAPAPTRLDYFESLADAAASGNLEIPDHARAVDRLTAASWHGALRPPQYLSVGSARSHPLLQRRLTHGLDLSRWMTQPSLVVIGHLRGAPAPFSVEVDGREAETAGRTIVRWVYPLPSDTPEYGGGG